MFIADCGLLNVYMNERPKYDSRSKNYGHHTVAVSLTNIDLNIHQRKDLNISDSAVNGA